MFLSFDEIVDDMMLYRMSEEEKTVVKGLAVKDLDALYLQSGHDIRTFYRLWDESNPYTLMGYKPQVVDGVDTNANHPDNFSMRVIQAIWKRLQ